MTKKYPALYVGLHMLLGCAWGAGIRMPVVYVLLALWFPFREKWQIVKGLVFFVLALLYSLPRPTEDNRFVISSVSIYHSPFKQTGYLYKGKWNNVPHSVISKHHYVVNCDYWMEGKDWKEVPGSFSFAEMRFQCKEALRKYLKRHISDAKVQAFLCSLATGEIEERTLAFEFSRLGLSHILAISGFHFGLIAFFFSFILKFFFSPKKTAFFLLCIITGYFFFMGNAPSVQRAWIAITMALLAQLFNLRYSSLNALGAGLIIAITLDPYVVSHLGFQLSFLCTLAILLLYPLCEKRMRWVFPKKSLTETLKFSSLDKYGYIVTTFLRKALALNFAVHLVALPTLLYLFHKFPLSSFAYNLFFPIGVTISLFLLILSFALPFLHQINSYFTSGLLHISSNPLPLFDVYVYSDWITVDLLFLFFGILLLCNTLQMKKDKSVLIFTPHLIVVLAAVFLR